MTGINGGKTGRDQDGRFGPGNPGRPPGARHKSTQAVLVLLDGEAVALTRKAIEKALEGDITALRLCLDRIAPPQKDPTVVFRLPTMTCAGDAAKAAAAVLAAVAEGELTPGEGAQVMALIDGYGRAIAATELEARLTALEGQWK